MNSDNKTNIELSRLRRSRCRTGRLIFATVLVAVIVVSLGLILAIDLSLHLDRFQRLTCLVAMIGATGWIFRRLRRSEQMQQRSLVQVAIDAEKDSRFDRTLVAALQFGGGRMRWGSLTLQRVVSERALGRTDAMQNAISRSRRQTRSVTIVLLSLISGVAVVGLGLGEKGLLFLQRLTLADVAYPSRVNVQQLEINNNIVFRSATAADRRADQMSAPIDSPITFTAWSVGDSAAAGSLCLSTSGGEHRRIELFSFDHSSLRTVLRELKAIKETNRSPSQQRLVLLAPSLLQRWPADDDDLIAFVGHLPQITQGMEYQLKIGDARPIAGQVGLLLPPVIDVALSVTPPEYAGQFEQITAQQSQRSTTVLAGSEVGLTVSCNNKRLQSVRAIIRSGDQEAEYTFVTADQDGRRWQTSDTQMLAAINSDTHYSLDIVDSDGMRPEQPITGQIRVRADEPPQVLIETIHKTVLPQARPTVQYQISDDFAIAGATLIMQRIRSGEPTETQRLPLKLSASDAAKQEVRMTGKHALDLARWELIAGDEVRLHLEVEDYRGSASPGTGISSPLTLKVGQADDVWSRVNDQQQDILERLSTIIGHQLDVRIAPK